MQLGTLVTCSICNTPFPYNKSSTCSPACRTARLDRLGKGQWSPSLDQPRPAPLPEAEQALARGRYLAERANRAGWNTPVSERYPKALREALDLPIATPALAAWPDSFPDKSEEDPMAAICPLCGEGYFSGAPKALQCVILHNLVDTVQQFNRGYAQGSRRMRSPLARYSLSTRLRRFRREFRHLPEEARRAIDRMFVLWI